MKPLRLRINTDIVTEFLPPRSGNGSTAIIFCDGCPSVPSKRSVLEYWSKRGFWVFHPRYKGTWESAGKFLDHDPTEDILEVARTVRSGELVSTRTRSGDKVPQPSIKRVIVVGASFGGAVALLSSLHSEIDKAVAISPVIDWSTEVTNSLEPLSDLKAFIRKGFGEAYRFLDSDFDRLGRDPQFFNPIAHVSEYDARKIFIMSAKDDMIVSSDRIVQFVLQTQCAYHMRKTGGHFSSSISLSLFAGYMLRRFIHEI